MAHIAFVVNDIIHSKNISGFLLFADNLKIFPTIKSVAVSYGYDMATQPITMVTMEQII